MIAAQLASRNGGSRIVEGKWLRRSGFLKGGRERSMDFARGRDEVSKFSGEILLAEGGGRILSFICDFLRLAGLLDLCFGKLLEEGEEETLVVQIMVE